MPLLELRRPNKNIMTAMSFEVHLWWGIDINENLKWLTFKYFLLWYLIWGYYDKKQLSVPHNQHLAQRYMWTAKCFEKGKQTLPEKVWVMDSFLASSLAFALLHGFEKMAGVQFKAFLQTTKKIVIPWPKMFLLAILCNESWHFRKAPCRRMSVENA